MHGHIIVCGDDALGMRIVEELNTAGATVLTVQTPTVWPRRAWPMRRR